VSAELSSTLSLPPEAWQELLALCQDETADRAMLERLLDLCQAAQGGGAAALYLEREGRMELELASSTEAAGPAGSAGQLAQPALGGLPRSIETGDGAPAGTACLRFPGGCLLFAPQQPAAGAGAAAAGGEGAPLSLLVVSWLRIQRLRQELKEQQFQVNYRVVELESLYDVGLAVAATLDLEKLSEEILLRAVSLLDARRGALYILEGARYRL